ncbi:MAG: 50S ribosomal protein L10 [Candidatus Firestonebacteria bacterium RIFOXYC2_FULL_39_67]|nr:MAG: 50S ribosomal protein L10 [Candidatus Firestonebacteria bacterium RIFOXYD2_FULL_39_29]OGF57228.1 MAG: 50S ribosomal protein L10 [Candidatus Firestonebacteria bacterium RIFOXYC2_FULL_39_67]
MSKAQLIKAEEVKALAAKFTKAKGIVFTNFTGLTVEDTTDFRKKVSKAGLEYKVIKNNIILRALKEVKLEDLHKFIDGPTGVVLSNDDPVIAAKLVRDFFKAHQNLKVRAGVVEGKGVGPAEVTIVADIPSRDILLGQVAGGLKAPLYKLVFVLNANVQKLVGTLDAIKKQKETAK